MQIKKLILATILSLSASTASVSASSLYLVQLGSYATEQDAEENWDALVSENSPILSGLFHQNSAITLPPANKKLYRLQAGPFDNRNRALETCGILTESVGQDCFVVETAMFQPKDSAPVSPPVMSSPEVSTPEAAVIANAASPIFDSAGSLNNDFAALESRKKVFFDKEEPNLNKDIFPESSIADIPSEIKDVTVETVSAEAVETTKNRISNIGTSLIDSSVDIAAEIRRIETLPITSLAGPATTAATEIPDIAVAAANTPLKQAILPWLRDDYEAPQIVKVEPLEVVRAEYKTPTVEEVTETPETPKSIVVPEISAPLFTPPVIAVAKPQLPAPVTAPLPIISFNDDAPKTIINKPLPQQKAKNVTAPLPVASDPFVGEYSDGATVEVAEAVQVPLSENEAPILASPAVQALPVLTGPKALGWGAKPSQNFMQKSLWAQLSYFSNEQAAVSYWDAIRRQFPELTNKMRMRMSKPYQQRDTRQKVSMQLGPVMAMADLKQLCNLAISQKLTCLPRRDVGNSAVANVKRYRTESSPLRSRRDMVSRRPTAKRGYWVQLGSFNSRGEASREWKVLQARHTKLDRLQPHINSPSLSSSAKKQYRLRTGPYSTRYAAEMLCDDLKMYGTSCLVLNN